MKLRLFLLLFGGLSLLAFGAEHVYHNYNQVGTGRGYIIVGSCSHAAGKYSCAGNFMQYQGMVTINNAQFTSSTSYHSNAEVQNLYLKYGNNNQPTKYLQTETQRRSLRDNEWAITAVALGALLAIIAVGMFWYSYIYDRSRFY